MPFPAWPVPHPHGSLPCRLPLSRSEHLAGLVTAGATWRPRVRVPLSVATHSPLDPTARRQGRPALAVLGCLGAPGSAPQLPGPRVGEASVVRVGGAVSTPRVPELGTFSECCSHSCFAFTFETDVALTP